MKSKPIHIVIGTRAQLIKMAPIMHMLEKRGLNYNFIYTAQHKESIDKLIDNFSLKQPDVDLSHNLKDEAKTISLFGRWLLKMFEVLLFKKRDLISKSGGIVLTHGDTVTTVWAALLGRFSGSKVMHVEAGLRSHNLLHPFPEELDRIITGFLSDVHMCPNEDAIKNLRKRKGEKVLTGANTVFDAVSLALESKEASEFDPPEEKYAVVSMHRFENIFDSNRFKQNIDIIKKVSTKLKVVFVLHPSTKKQLLKEGVYLSLKENPNIDLIPRLGYPSFIQLMNGAEFVITDGGSNQQELSYMGKPTLLLRLVTGNKEGMGKNTVLSKYDEAVIFDFINNYADYKIQEDFPKNSPSQIIVDWLQEHDYA